MRKRLFCLALALLFLWGCTPHPEVPKDPVAFYYPRAELAYSGDDAVIAPEQREALGLREEPQTLLAQYLLGPQNPELRNPFPQGTALARLNCSGKTASVTLSEEFAGLEGLDLRLACACLVRTVTAITGCETVRLSASGANLAGRKWLTLTADTLLLSDNSKLLLQDSMVLYLVDEERACLIPSPVTITLTSGSSGCTELMERFLSGDAANGLRAPLPEGTRLLGVSVEGGLCAVNFSAEFEAAIPQDTAEQYRILQSIANTLTQLNYVSGVNFYCEGTRLLHYGAMDTQDSWKESPLSVCQDLEDTVVAKVYVSSSVGDGLAAIPVCLGGSNNLPEKLLQQVLSLENFNGFLSPIPVGTYLRGVTVENGVCTIDVSEAFLEQPEALPDAVHALVAAVCSLPEIDAARVLVNGETPEGDFGGLFSVLTPQTEWFSEYY